MTATQPALGQVPVIRAGTILADMPGIAMRFYDEDGEDDPGEDEDDPDDHTAPMVRMEVGFTVKAIDEENRTADFLCSSETLDSYDEIVKQDWILKRFRKNPVVLYGHVSWGLTLPIGTCVKIGLTDEGNLWARVKFATEKANPFAEQVWNCVLEKVLRAVSVGFRPHTVKWETVNDVERMVLSRNELFELSVVPIGANPDAVGLSGDAAKAHEKQMRRLRSLAAQNRESENETNEVEMPKNETTNTAELTELEARAAAAEAELERLRRTNASLAEANEKAAKEAEKAKALAVKNEAKTLIGKKFGPSCVKAYIILAAGENADVFAEFVKNLPDMPHTNEQVGDEPVPKRSKKQGNAIAALAQKMLDEELGNETSDDTDDDDDDDDDDELDLD